MQKYSDEELVEKIRNGKADHFEILIKRYQNKLYGYIVYLINDKEKAKDVLQETLIKAYKNLNSFNIAKKFSSWIYRIAHNEAINVVKKYKNEFNMPIHFDFKSNEDIENEYSSQELKEKVQACLKNMPLLYSEPLALFYLEEKSYEEIGDILRLPVSTVGVRIKRAKLIFKKLCKKII